MNSPISPFVDIAMEQRNKTEQLVCGDCFFVQRSDNRIIAVLSDGLGSGIKAAILSKMTASMALKFIANDNDLTQSAKIIMKTLPVCQVRQISYATFTILDITPGDAVRIIELGNPGFLHFQGDQLIEHEPDIVVDSDSDGRTMRVTTIHTGIESRIIVFSDGITQSGLGTPECKLGFRREGCADFCHSILQKDPEIASSSLSAKLVREALKYEKNRKNLDDMTVASIYFRQPRKLTVMAGPPFHQSKDHQYVMDFMRQPGRKIICGGTTSNIVSRVLDREIYTQLKCRGKLPLSSTMEGVDLITEGVLTLTRVASILESGEREDSPAQDLVDILLNSDQVDFMVGTRINEAHQDPTLPEELEIRRSIINRIGTALKNTYLKELEIHYI
jgi:hypothetical protein